MRIIVLTLLLFTSSAFAKQQNFNFCTVALSENTEDNITETFAAYLPHLKNETVVNTETLHKLKDELEQNKGLSNPVVNKSSSDYEIHFNNVNDYLTSPTLDRITLLKYLTQSLAEQEQVQHSKTESIRKTKDSSHKLKLHLIKAGSFTKNDKLNSPIEKVTLNHSFLMMDTKVTEKMWRDLYGTTDSNGLPNDYPVTNITAWAAMQFANEMSKRDGLEPAYIINHSLFKGDPQSRNFIYDDISQPYSRVRINAPIDDIYQTEGYRLPTIEEQWFARTNRGEVQSNEFFPGVTKQNIRNFTWLNQDEPQNVADLLPLVIDGNNFYDLYGNVEELVQRVYANRFVITSIGGSYRDSTPESVLLPQFSLPIHSANHIGFRLVRTVKEKKP